MKVVGLVSGGKDSCFAMMKCLQYGHEVVALANLLPADESVDDLDSYMYQTVGHQIVVSYAKCMGVPLFRRRIQGSTRLSDLHYNETPGDEVEDMFILLAEVKKHLPSITAVSSGAIASDYQRLRVESVCSRLGLISLAYLWKLDQSWLLQEMIASGIVAITVKVAAIGLEPSKHLGKEMSCLKSHLLTLKELYGINVCGEGGEYETLTLDCPLFKNARIVLDESQSVLNAANPIAPVGILHPSAFHLEYKSNSASVHDENRMDEMNAVFEVQGDGPKRCECDCADLSLNLVEAKDHRLQISRIRRNGTFSMSCWLQDSQKDSTDLQKELKLVLANVESQLLDFGLSWENVLYIHLYIDDMNKFTIANETYVVFITQEKCQFGVPSRCTIELPLSIAGLGRAYVEILAVEDHTKRVLHVQSISCWAPSCIGPYSQATLHNEILHMAGQLGLDAATMLLRSGGAKAELEQALENSEAVANCFNCSITSTILFVIYCSASIPASDRESVQEKLEYFLEKMKLHHSENGKFTGSLTSVFLYVLVPDLPKGAFVEVKPILYVKENAESKATDETVLDISSKDDETILDISSKVDQQCWGLQHDDWLDCCHKKCVVPGKLCAIILSITRELASRIYADEFTVTYLNDVDSTSVPAERRMKLMAQFCIYFLDKILFQNGFSWDDITNLRIYFPTSTGVAHEALSLILTHAFCEFSEASKKLEIHELPIFNLIPVLGAGSCAASVDDVLTCELFAHKS